MTDITQLPDLPIEIGPRSSIFEKTTPELRRKLDRAILNYDPPGYRALYKKYGLPELGVSFTAFYNYARRLRRRAAACDMALTTLPDERESARLLPALVGQCLIDQLMTGDEAAPNAVYRLMLAYTAAINNAIKVHEAGHVFPRQTTSTSQISNPEISNPPAPSVPNLVNPVNPVLSSDDKSADDLLAQANSAFEREQAALAADEARLAARFEQAKKDFTAMGYPVAHVQTIDELEEIIQNTEPNPAAHVAPNVSPPAPNPVNPVRSNSPEPPPLISQRYPDPDPEREKRRREIQEIYRPFLEKRPLPPLDSDLPVPRSPNLVNPVNPVPSTSDAIVSTADDEFRVTPEERRRREFLRVALSFGLIKPDAPLPDSS